MESRRYFLKLGGSAALGVIGWACSSKDGAKEASGPIAAGNVSAVAVGSFAFVPGVPVVLGRDAGGLYAMSAICTHEQCDMRSDGSIDKDGVHCSCHGSSFSKNGAPTAGPANAPLRHYRVDLAADGAITVQASITADANARTAVPG